MATTAPPADADPPECPVCLSPFDATSAVPRVLPCGHSLCGPCIGALPPASAAAAGSSLRCPLCCQCVPFSRALGPSSLPKNLALLALLPSSPPSPSHTITATAPAPLPLPLHASHSRLLSRFRHAVLPESASPLRSAPTPACLASGSLDSDLGAPWFCARGSPVSLLPIETRPGEGRPPAEQEAEFYRPSHAARVLAAIGALSDAAMEELAGLIASSARLARRVCRVYGVWMDPDAPPLWMVSERHPRSFSQLLEEEMVAQIGFVVMEACEVIMRLHGEGLALGCLGLDCFCLDSFGHCLLDFSRVLALCRGVRAGVSSYSIGALIAPEVVAVLGDTLRMKNHDFDGFFGCSSDIWSLGCLLVSLLTRDERLVAGWNSEGSYDDWEKKVGTRLNASLLGTQLEPLAAIIVSCLSYDPKGRPEIADVWKCVRGLLMKSGDVTLAPDDDFAVQKSFRCLLLGELSSMFAESSAVESDGKAQLSRGAEDSSSNQDDVSNGGCRNDRALDLSGIDDPESAGMFKSATLIAHRDCVTGLAIGGGFLFSSSYDKTINVWSLQDFSHVQCLKGHEHKITTIVVVDNENHSLCISGDSGSGIFVWRIDSTLKEEPLNKWYEHNDWLYRGVICLAVSGTGYLYSGSRDKSIKAWSLEDYSLRCTMTGHKSTVSCLAVASGILYSGSWDGTIRSWWLTDHTPLSVLEDDIAGSIAPVLSISTEANFVVSSYENGYFKIWKNDVLVKSEKLQNGAIYAVKLSGKWFYSGGWDKIIKIQELLEDESEVELRDVASITCDTIITSILSWDERLIVGQFNRDIKVYYKAQ
ncbi:hypothetical protein PAHAL_3G274600 [Panicum hallii]|uniref:RING-type domain-containing protein n=1 Tax=Panicum hallii TaxID=206008 RepID=A0A2S3HC92_9POAL|nr:uncharacterized protein LOC112884585 isoform X1 [Panicum hallii]PAN19452.1 hypothetical protein PAHAL_3G274600 [Panicum hallii]